jgi:hypothetical protein
MAPALHIRPDTLHLVIKRPFKKRGLLMLSKKGDEVSPLTLGLESVTDEQFQLSTTMYMLYPLYYYYY